MGTEERLEKLERELCVEKRRNRWLLAAVLIGLVGGGLAWTWWTITATFQGANIGWKVIRANQLLLGDENGKLRATLNVSKDGTGLSLADENGRILAQLSVNKHGTSLYLLDENGKMIWSRP